MNIDQTKILIDSDVTIHFIEGDSLDNIPQIYPGRIVYVDKVLEELYSFPQYKIQVFNFVQRHQFEKIELGSNYEYFLEYADLIQMVGKGEAACMAIAKIDKKYIASSNLRDITEYCNKHKIKKITTMDFLWEAINKKVMSIEDCDEFITKVKNAGGKLPVDTIEEYVKKYIMKG